MAERVQSAVDYPWVFTVKDNLGMTSTVQGIIPVDVLVIREGNVLKMAVPSIIFRPDNADFKVESAPGKRDGVTSEQAANNERILKRIAEILNKFKDYKITVVGHANRTSENEAEETQDNPRQWGPALIPLSQRRAEFVKSYLVDKGVLSPIGVIKTRIGKTAASNLFCKNNRVFRKLAFSDFFETSASCGSAFSKVFIDNIAALGFGVCTMSVCVL